MTGNDAVHIENCTTEAGMEYLECAEVMPSTLARMGDQGNNNTQSIADYLAQLLKDKKQLAAFPNVFIHMERLLDDGKFVFWNNCDIMDIGKRG